MNIFECADKYRELVDFINDNDGAVDDDTWKQLEATVEDAHIKVKAYRGITLRNEASIKLYEDEAERLKQKAKRLKDTNERIKEFAIFAIETFGDEDSKTGVKRLTDGDFKASIRKVKVMDYSEEAQKMYEDAAKDELVEGSTKDHRFLRVDFGKLPYSNGISIYDKFKDSVSEDNIKVSLDRRGLWDYIKDLPEIPDNDSIPVGVSSKISKSVLYK